MPALDLLRLSCVPALSEKWWEGVVYSVWGDESHDEKADFIFVVSGVFGNENDWNSAASAWLEITKGEEFHAAEWSSRPEYTRLCRVIANSTLIGYAAGMDLRDYETIFPNPVEQLPYYFCFSDVVQHMADIASDCIPQDKVEFIFDRNFDVKYNATFLYDCMIKFPEFEHWDSLSSSNRQDVAATGC